MNVPILAPRPSKIAHVDATSPETVAMTDRPPLQESFAIPGQVQRRAVQKLRNLVWRLIAPLPDRPYLCLKYRILKGVWPNLDRPRTFSEKVQHRKLNDRNPLYATLIDKAAAKTYIDTVLGAPYAVPAQWVGTDLADIDWSGIELPAVIKPTHA